MAGTARDAFRQAGIAGLLAGTACAVIQNPPGGPPDFAPPVILAITPDSGTIADSLEDHLEIQFDEVISEQSGGGIENLVLVSPRRGLEPREVDVDWRRTKLAVRPDGGWIPNVVYQVTLLPGITDLSNNRLDSGRTVIFSTGGPVPDTRIDGIVLDWENGRAGVGALVEAILLPDSLVYSTTADSSGSYALVSLPPGTYHLVGSIDDNGNRRRERREAFDSATVRLDSVVSYVAWAFVQDTVGPILRQARFVDSLTVEVQFAQKLAPGDPPADAISFWALPDTTPVAVAAVWTKAVYDSVYALERQTAISDSLAAESLEADTLAADSVAVDTMVRDTIGIAGEPVQTPPGVMPDVGTETQPTDTVSAALQALLDTRPPLRDTWFLRMVEPLTPGQRYQIEATARNPNGVAGTSRQILLAPIPADST